MKQRGVKVGLCMEVTIKAHESNYINHGDGS